MLEKHHQIEEKMVPIDAKCFASIACSMNNEKEGEMNKYMTVGKTLKLSLIWDIEGISRSICFDAV